MKLHTYIFLHTGAMYNCLCKNYCWKKAVWMMCEGIKVEHLHVQDSRCFKWVIALLVIIISGRDAASALFHQSCLRWLTLLAECVRALWLFNEWLSSRRPATTQSAMSRVIRGCLPHFALKRTKRKPRTAFVRQKSKYARAWEITRADFNELPFRCFAHKTSVMRRCGNSAEMAHSRFRRASVPGTK